MRSWRWTCLILGPLEVLDEGRTLALGGAKQRALLGLLLLHVNEPVSQDRLVDGLWGDEPPAAAAKTLQVHVSRLRKALGSGLAGELATRGRGYALELDPERIDAHRFQGLVSGARAELASGRPGGAVPKLEAALAMWRGPPLADLAYETFAQGEIARLEDLVMLETVREFAVERLEADEGAREVHARHLAHYQALLDRTLPDLFTRRESLWLLDPEVDNFRAALGWSIVEAPADCLVLVGALGSYWSRREVHDEGLAWLEAGLEAAGDEAPAGARAEALLGMAGLRGHAGSPFDPGMREKARALAGAALELFRQVGDDRGAGWALLNLAWFAESEGFPQHEHRAMAEAALAHARAAGDEHLVAVSLADAALALAPQQAVQPIDDAARAVREIGETWNLCTLYWYAAHNAIRVRDLELAGRWLHEALTIARELDDAADLGFEPAVEGLYALFTGDLGRASTAFCGQLPFCVDRGVPQHAARGLGGLGAVAAARARDERAARLLGAASAIGPIDDEEVVEQLEEGFFSPARARLGAERFDEAHAEGARLSFEEAVALAIPDLG